MEAAGARLSWTPFHADDRHPIWGDVLAHTAATNARGVPVLPQVATQPITVPFGFDEFSWIIAVPGFGEPLRGFFDLDHQDRRSRLADPDTREALRAAADQPADHTAMFAPDPGRWVLLRSRSHPEWEGDTLAAVAGRTGIDEIVASEHTLIGLGDSGAHVTSINNFSYPSFVLASIVRERGVLTLEDAVRRLTSVPASFLGLVDRGRLQVGAPADIWVFDAEIVAPGRVRTAHDLPGGAARLVQDAVGYRAVLVNGVATVVDDQPTGAGPGRVLRAVART